LIERLDGEAVRVAVDDQGREAVGLGVGVVDDAVAVRLGGRDALLEEGHVCFDGL